MHILLRLLAKWYKIYTKQTFAFEYDPTKSQSNKAKHGIYFEEAQALWRDKKAYRMSARSSDEQRFAIGATLNGKHWFAVYTMRGNTIRIISVRRARKNEVEQYEQQ